jgi:hypothetical protein
LKKRTKKLLSIARSFRNPWVDSVLHETDKSFLVLFFKKELLPSFFLSEPWPTTAIPARVRMNQRGKPPC